MVVESKLLLNSGMGSGAAFNLNRRCTLAEGAADKIKGGFCPVQVVSSLGKKGFYLF